MERKNDRYDRIKEQLTTLFSKTSDPVARMTTLTAVLHNKFDYYFWTGFYRLIDGELTVTCYQGSVACLILKKHTGVCWAAIDRDEPVIVPDVHSFDGHIVCDARTKSEIVIPAHDTQGNVVAVLDVDSRNLNSFDQHDAAGLQELVDLIYHT